MQGTQKIDEDHVTGDLNEQIRRYIVEENSTSLGELLDSLSLSDALREVLLFSPEERDILLSLLPTELAAELIEERQQSWLQTSLNDFSLIQLHILLTS